MIEKSKSETISGSLDRNVVDEQALVVRDGDHPVAVLVVRNAPHLRERKDHRVNQKGLSS